MTRLDFTEEENDLIARTITDIVNLVGWKDSTHELDYIIEDLVIDLKKGKKHGK